MINKELKKSNFNTICVKCSSNNTIISLVNPEGSIITTLSSGHLKYKGSRKGICWFYKSRHKYCYNLYCFARLGGPD